MNNINILDPELNSGCLILLIIRVYSCLFMVPLNPKTFRDPRHEIVLPIFIIFLH